MANINCPRCSCKVYPALIRPIDTTHRPIMIIGESVTAAEARKGEVMTGPGGDVLRQTMTKVGLPISDDKVCYTTALACAIPKKKGGSVPKDAIANCRTRLVEEIRAVNPKLVLVCGKVALQTLTGDMGIKVTTEYGRVREYDFLPEGVQVIPIMNPGLILRSPNDYKPFLTMLQLAATIYGGGSTVDTGTSTWTVLDTEEKCLQAWKHLKRLNAEGKLPYASYDIETTSIDYRIAKFMVMGIGYEKNKTYVFPRDMQHLVHNFLENVPWKCIWQHGKYDKRVLWKLGLGNVSIDHDTMYMHYVLDETSAHDLGYLSKVFLNAEDYKYKMNQNFKAVTEETYDAFFESLCERVAVDCDYTLQLTDVLTAKLAEVPALNKLYNELLIPAANYLSRVEQNGILINAEYLENLDVKYDVLLDKIKAEIAELAEPFWDRELYMIQSKAKSAPIFFNPGSPQQMAWMVFDRLKLKPRIKKARSTNKEILKSIEPTPPLISKVLEYRTVQKEQSTYVKGILNARDDDGRVRTTFSLHIAATGRLTSKEPNVQNQPSAHGVGNIRQAFVARPGYVLAEIDYSGAELRWLAFLSKCPVLMDIFQQNKNLHNETATALFGPHYSKAEKMRAKAVNFGIPYGREYKSFMDEFNITKEEAEKMISDWLDTYYGAKEYLTWCADQVIAGRYLETPFGRRRRFGLVAKETLSALRNEARNFPIQSSSSDLLLVSGMAMEKPLLDNYNTKQLNLIHDSILLEIPADKQTLMAVGKYSNGVMTTKPVELFNCPVPFKTDFEIGPDWGNLEGFNWETGNIEIERDDGSIFEIDFDDWWKYIEPEKR